MKKLFLCSFLILVLSFSLICIASAADDGFMTFEPYGIYKTAEPLDTLPVTY